MSTTTATRTFAATLLLGEFHSPGPGISADAEAVEIVTTDDAPESIDSTPTVRLVTRSNVWVCGGMTLHHFEPVAPVPTGAVGYMASGAHVLVSLEAARTLGIHAAAYPLHDRYEQ